MLKFDVNLLNAAVINPATANNDLGVQAFEQAIGAQIVYNLSALDAAQTVQLTLIGVAKDGTQFQFLQTTALAAPGILVIDIFPGSIATGTIGTTTVLSLSAPMPSNWFVRETFSNTTGTKPATRSLSYTGFNS